MQRKRDENRLTVSPDCVCHRKSDGRERRGAAAVFGLILTASLVILMAVTLDFGYVLVSQTEVRRSADATVLAACWELFDQQVHSNPQAVPRDLVHAAATLAASRNLINKEVPTVGLSENDLTIGHYSLVGNGGFVASTLNGANAVRVRLARQTSLNGEVPLFFGPVTGRYSQAFQAYSVAAMLNTISGFNTPPGAGETVQILPIALDLQTWNNVVAGQTNDSVKYENGAVVSGSDGLFECNLYPQGTGSPGNRGTVDIGGSNNSTADLSRQVVHGISQQDFMDLGKPLAFNANGVLELNGDTGISAGIKDELASIIGQKRIIPIFSSVSGNGNNAIYQIVRFEGVRILDVKLTGQKNSKRVTIQPAKMVARHCILSTDASHASEYLVSPVMIVE